MQRTYIFFFILLPTQANEASLTKQKNKLH